MPVDPWVSGARKAPHPPRERGEVLGEALDRMEETERLEIMEAVVGRQMSAALSREPLRILVDKAVEKICIGRTQLEALNPSDVDRIREVQNDIRVARMFISFVSEVIINGAHADERIALKEME
jgi:hypothetical protein